VFKRDTQYIVRDEKVQIPVTFSYQACDDRVCYPPTQVKLALEVKLVPHDTERTPEAIQKKGKTP
jgi:hypothetical protein